MNFKEFLVLSEDAPLGNIQPYNDGSVGVHNDGFGGFSLKKLGGGYLDSQWTGSEANPQEILQGHPMHLGSLDLKIPDEIDEQVAGRVSGFSDEAYRSSRIPLQIEVNGERKQYTFTPEEFQRISKGCPPRIMDGDTLVLVQEKLGNNIPIKGKPPAPRIKKCKCYPTSHLRKARQ